MLIQERYDRMDWVTYGNEQKKEGEIRGAIKTCCRMGKTPSEILKFIMDEFSLKKDDAEKFINDVIHREITAP